MPMRHRAFALVGALLGATALGSTGVAAKDITIMAVTHGQASDPFWSRVKDGIAQAGKDQGVRVGYRAPETFDMVAMIDAALNQQPDDIVISDPDPHALGPSIKTAVAAGIPVISMNSGFGATAKLLVLLHVGRDEQPAGRIVGARNWEMGLNDVLCVNQEVGNAALDRRCQGVKDGLAGRKMTVLPTSADSTERQPKIRAALSSDPSIDGVIGLSAPLVGEPAVAAVAALDPKSKVEIGSFDLSPASLTDVADGKAAFAVDQQPDRQGYLPVTFLAQRAKTGTMPAGNVATGPRFVTRDNAKQVNDMSAKRIR